MIKIEYTGSFVFTISDEQVDFKDILLNMNICPTKIIKKGQFIISGKNAPYDIWSFEIKILNDIDNPFVYLTSLLDQLLPYAQFIKKICKQYNQVAINCYLRSDFGQIGFEITNDMISKLEILGIGINFHILSYGFVE